MDSVTRVRLVGAAGVAAGALLMWVKWVYVGGICPVGVVLIAVGALPILFPRVFISR